MCMQKLICEEMRNKNKLKKKQIKILYIQMCPISHTYLHTHYLSLVSIFLTKI